MNVWMECQDLSLDFKLGVLSMFLWMNLSEWLCECLNWIVRMLLRISLKNVWISEWSVRICSWISFWVSCLNLSADVCMNDVWMSERIVRMLWRICLIMYESLNGVSGFASFSFFWVVLFKYFCWCVYEWCMNVWTNC